MQARSQEYAGKRKGDGGVVGSDSHLGLRPMGLIGASMSPF